MAGIDKTYTSSYQEYKEFKDWADTQVITFYDGLREHVGDWIYRLEEGDFVKDGEPFERSIMNTPTWMDTYLIQNCLVEFVQARMRDVYGVYYEVLKSRPFPSRPIGKKNRRIRVRKAMPTSFPLQNKSYKGHWWIQCNDNLWYNEETRTWADPELYPTNTNTAHLRTVKAVVRHLRKQHLPTGITFTLMGRYVGEEYLITVK